MTFGWVEGLSVTWFNIARRGGKAMSLQRLPPITEQGLQREEEVQESGEGRVVDEQRALDPLPWRDARTCRDR